MTTPCTEKENIINLKKDNEYMTNIIKEIKWDVKDMKWDITLIKEFILTSPQKFITNDEYIEDKKINDNFKKEIIDFKNKVNTKIVVISTIFAISVWIINLFKDYILKII